MFLLETSSPELYRLFNISNTHVQLSNLCSCAWMQVQISQQRSNQKNLSWFQFCTFYCQKQVIESMHSTTFNQISRETISWQMIMFWILQFIKFYYTTWGLKYVNCSPFYFLIWWMTHNHLKAWYDLWHKKIANTSKMLPRIPTCQKEQYEDKSYPSAVPSQHWTDILWKKI